jgi:hypothetical protein
MQLEVEFLLMELAKVLLMELRTSKVDKFLE